MPAPIAQVFPGIFSSNARKEFNPINERLDLTWSGGNSTDRRFSNYYDYYFSGEDIKIFIDGLFDPNDELDIATFAFNVRQEKQPLYGFWSYNYDAIMYGTRIITGEIALYTRYPRRMTELLEKAASTRSALANNKSAPGRVLSNLRSQLETEEDEALIDKYWERGQLDRITDDPYFKNIIDSNRNIFSAHPPFNLVIVYGMEEVALSPKNLFQTDTNDLEFNGSLDNLSRTMLSDVNQRVVKSTSLSSPMKIVIQEVNLINMSTVYAPGGQPVVETYQFMARDHYFTEVDTTFIKRASAENVSSGPLAPLAIAENLNYVTNLGQTLGGLAPII